MQLQKDIREAVEDLKAILQLAVMLTSQETTEMLSSQGSVEMEENSANTLQNGNIKTQNSHVKRPMNAFFLYSQQNRKAFKELYPGRDNREITIILSEHWCSLKPELKEPYKDKARELMRITRESHPDFKYHKARKETGEALLYRDGKKQVSQDQGYRIGSYTLRQRTATTGRRLEPAPKRIKRSPGFQPNIKDVPASGMANQTGTTVAAAVEPYKLPLSVNQGESTCEDEEIQESCMVNLE